MQWSIRRCSRRCIGSSKNAPSPSHCSTSVVEMQQGIGPALAGTQIATYVGVDCAAPALEFAEATLSGTVAEFDLRLGDLMDTIEDPSELFDVVLVSFALHHFPTMTRSAS